jgi:hypothetical protein
VPISLKEHSRQGDSQCTLKQEQYQYQDTCVCVCVCVYVFVFVRANNSYKPQVAERNSWRWEGFWLG